MSTCGYQTSKGPCKTKTGGGLCWRHSGGGSVGVKSTGGKGGIRKEPKKVAKHKGETKKITKPKVTKSRWESVSHEEVADPSTDEAYTSNPDYTLYIGHRDERFDFSKKQIKELGVEPVFWTEDMNPGKVFHFKPKEKSILYFALALTAEKLTWAGFHPEATTVLGFSGLGPKARDLKKVLKFVDRKDPIFRTHTEYFKYRNKLIKVVLLGAEPVFYALYKF